MANINDNFKAALVAFLGHDGHFNELLVEFLQTQTGSTSSNTQDLWKVFIEALGTTSGQLNDRLVTYFKAQGLSGHYNDMFLQALIDGLLIFSALLLENGDYLLQEDGTSFILQE